MVFQGAVAVGTGPDGVEGLRLDHIKGDGEEEEEPALRKGANGDLTLHHLDQTSGQGQGDTKAKTNFKVVVLKEENEKVMK